MPKYLKKVLPPSEDRFLYQNDDFGKGYLTHSRPFSVKISPDGSYCRPTNCRSRRSSPI